MPTGIEKLFLKIKKQQKFNGEPSIFLLPKFFATQNIGGAKEVVVLL